MDDLSNKKERKLNIDSIDFEALFKKQQEEHEKQREAYYKEKAKKKGTSLDSIREKRKKSSDEVTVYKAKAAALTFKEKAAVKESFIHRTIRLVKGLGAVRKQIKTCGVKLTQEMKTKLYRDLFEDAWEPVTDFFKGMVDDSWEFLCTFWDDLIEIIVFIVNLIITASYYVGSVLIYIWDIIWDIRLWFDARKNKIFQYFALSVGILAVALISISSISAYEYSYYGRVLGITRTKQEVYQTIDALGEKLSEASGANVNLDVERDIKFKRVVGLNLDVDNSEDILNTLTYMKDIQVRAYAININGKQAVVLENEDTANNVLQAVRDYFVPEVPNVEYTSVTYDQTVTIDEVGVLLGDIWNPSDAAMYIERGTTKISDEIKVDPLITVRTTEVEKTEKNVEFGTKYIESSELYVGEHDLISAGIYGVNEIVSEISRVNGQEIQRVVVSTTRTKNPVDAVYYTGTKPVPEKKGTGTFIWPIKNMKKSMITSKFGGRNTGIIGASTNHEGMDIGVPYGTKVYACDGGVVTFAGWRAGYGYVVIIDHGGLYETRYAHNSKLLVSTGDEIYQGQAIANAGNSGVSSGPHCHLEIRFNGVAKNPLNYLPEL
ncbi:MAG: peptidoglycan DD-metalloendopeptidase family protein [Clostridia bacterium]|nr:peptidoglycan DD-metalloendopeptidase family protein [Clostridia bacterium]